MFKKMHSMTYYKYAEIRLMYVPKHGKLSCQTALNFARLQGPKPFLNCALVNNTMIQIKELESLSK